MHRPLPTISPGGRRSHRGPTAITNSLTVLPSNDNMAGFSLEKGEHQDNISPQTGRIYRRSMRWYTNVILGPHPSASPSYHEGATATDASEIASAANLYPSPPDFFPSPSNSARGVKRKRTPTLTSSPFPGSSSTNNVDQTLALTSLAPPGSGLGLMQPPIITTAPQSHKSELTSHVPDPADTMHIYSQRSHTLVPIAPYPTPGSTQIPGAARQLSASAFSPNPASASGGPNLTYDAFWSSLSSSSHSGAALLQAHRLGVRSSFPSTSSSQV